MKANLDDFEILYENTIALHSKSKSTKVIIVDHYHQKCIEIVAYNALISLDTARLYINGALLVEKINCMPDFAIKMDSTIEAREASSQHFDFQAFRKDLVKSFTVKYILARLDTPKDMARGSFSILLNPIEDDLKDKHGRLDVVRNMPHNLKIYEFDHIKRYVDAALFVACLFVVLFPGTITKVMLKSRDTSTRTKTQCTCPLWERVRLVPKVTIPSSATTGTALMPLSLLTTKMTAVAAVFQMTTSMMAVVTVTLWMDPVCIGLCTSPPPQPRTSFT